MSIFNNPTSTLSPNSASASHHRPIELQSPHDLTYISNAISLHTQSKLSQSSSSSSSSSSADPRLQSRINALLENYTTTVLSLAKPNLSINGLTGPEMEKSLLSTEVLEEFDAGLAGRIQGFSARIEGLRMELAGLRREGPRELGGRWEERWDAGEGEEGLGEREEEEGVEKVEVDVQRLEEVGRGFERGVKELERVKVEIGGTVEKLERAKKGVEVLSGGS